MVVHHQRNEQPLIMHQLLRLNSIIQSRLETIVMRTNCPLCMKQGAIATHTLTARRSFELLCLMLLSTLLVACGGPPAVPGETQPLVLEAPVIEDPGAITQGLDLEEAIRPEQIDNESPWEMAIRADQSAPDVAIALRLQAIDLFLEQDEYSSAETQVNYLLDAPLGLDQKLQLTLQRGRIAHGRGDNLLAIEFLQPLKSNPIIDSETKALALLVLADAQLSLARKVDAIVSLLHRDPLVDAGQKTSNQQFLVQLISGLSDLERSILRQTAFNNGFDPNLTDGWIAFADISTLTPTAQEQQLRVWITRYPNHPADQRLLGGELQIALDSYKQIALLLPLTSPFGNAAQAFYDGFIDAHNEDRNPYRPSITLHDIGEDPSLVTFYYQSAVIEGADFVIGPLGRGAVSALLEQLPLRLPTLVLGDIEPGRASNDLYGISLSPELEAAEVARRAFQDGHRQAAVMRSDDKWGARTANAFVQTWLELGGKIVADRAFANNITDYSRVIQQTLEVNQSVVRERVLSAQLGIDLKFTPRRRQDTDFLFLAADAKQARLLVPQLRFFQAHDLPMYATSKIFTGRINPAVDADLDSLTFGDMRWMLDIQYTTPEGTLSSQTESDQIEQESPEVEVTDSVAQTQLTEPPTFEPTAIAKSPYSFSPLDRLYALGYESYHLVPRLSVLRTENWQRYQGRAFEASVREDGNVLRHLQWATFEKGELKLLDALPKQQVNN